MPTFALRINFAKTPANVTGKRIPFNSFVQKINDTTQTRSGGEHEVDNRQCNAPSVYRTIVNTNSTPNVTINQTKQRLSPRKSPTTQTTRDVQRDLNFLREWGKKRDRKDTSSPPEEEEQTPRKKRKTVQTTFTTNGFGTDGKSWDGT